MEDWQIEHITKNLPKLSEHSVFNWNVKAELLATKILCKADVEKIDVDQNQKGNSYASYQGYQMLMGRTDAYKVLTNVLLQTNQTGAAGILIRVPVELCEKPLTYLGISTKLEKFKDAEMEVNGKTVKVHEFFPGANYEHLWQIFQATVNELEIYDTFVTKQRTFVLSINTVPPKPLYYVPRFLSNRIKVDESVFKAACPDVFVFKNQIARYKLSEIARPHSTDTSTSQLTKITCRFIYLEENEDWDELKKIARVPIHLINYEACQEGTSEDWLEQEDSSGSEADLGYCFVLEDTTSASDILKKLGSLHKRVYLTEEDFVEYQLSESCTTSLVCICDTPGMGKTFLLANIARKMTEKCAGNITSFIQLTSFAKAYSPESTKTNIQPETSLFYVLSNISASKQNSQLLFELVKTKQLSLEIFFDGFDELPADKVEWTRQVFRSITTFENVRIYITSRPHMRRGLETSLGVVAYDILPFNQKNQVDFLVLYWTNRKPDADQVSLQSYATDCLEAVNESLTENDKEIAGIPLLCQLIAEVYGDKKAFRSIKTGSFRDVPLQISGMYRTVIENNIHLVTSNQDEFENIKLVCIWHALKLLFPTNNFHKTKLFQKIKHLLISPKLLKAGILQKHSNGALEFIHRTFAEFLVAEYFSTWLKDEEMQKTDEMCCNSISILRCLLKLRQIYLRNYVFVHPVIVSFFNSAIGEVNFSEELKIPITTFISSFSNHEFTSILGVCCQHKFLNIFSFLGEVLTKCDKSWLLQCFTHGNCYELLKVCIRMSTSQMFHSCIHLLTEVLKFDVAQINIFLKDNTLLQIAAECANYAAVEYFMVRVPFKNQSLLEKCIGYSDDIEKRESILRLLLNKDATLVHETPDILVRSLYEVDVKLFKILVEFGGNLTAVKSGGYNCAMRAAEHMSPSDYHELVKFLLTDCKAGYLFVDNEKWIDPLPFIIKWVTLLPETMELLLSIPGNDINMKDRWEESLLFSAVKGNKMNNLELLVKSGVDYKSTNMWNGGLLHVAADLARVEMVLYLLSLKLDPNSRDQDDKTPLHCAAIVKNLSVVEVLVENRANVQAKDKYGTTALHLSVTYCSSQSIEIIRYLIGKEAEVNDRNNKGNTPLHLCRWNEEVKEYLIEMGADIYAKNNKGKTPAQKNPELWKSSN